MGNLNILGVELNEKNYIDVLNYAKKNMNEWLNMSNIDKIKVINGLK